MRSSISLLVAYFNVEVFVEGGLNFEVFCLSLNYINNQHFICNQRIVNNSH